MSGGRCQGGARERGKPRNWRTSAVVAAVRGAVGRRRGRRGRGAGEGWAGNRRAAHAGHVGQAQGHGPGAGVEADDVAGAAVIAASAYAQVANWVVFVAGAAVGAAGTPVKVGLASSAPPAAVMSAASRVTAPALVLKVTTPAPPASAAATNAVVASCRRVPGEAVGACGVPVKFGSPAARRRRPTRRRPAGPRRRSCR